MSCQSAFLLICLVLATACDRAPAGGGAFFTGGLTEAREGELVAGQAAAGLAAAGGEYPDARLAGYVARVGSRIAHHAERPRLNFRFRVLDDAVPNAFAWPNGEIQVSRGLLALLNDEAELAAVLAHEIGHVTARHAAETFGLETLSDAARRATSIALGRWAEASVETVSPVLLAVHRRGQEQEADALALRYLVRAGYDAAALGRVLERLADYRQLSGTAQPTEAGSLLSSHPDFPERIAAFAFSETASTGGAQEPGHLAFLRHLEGLTFGPDADRGYLRGRRFLHPGWRITFLFPEGFEVMRLSERLLAVHPQGAAVTFDSQRLEPARSLSDYLARDWAKDLPLGELAPLTINGLEAATAETLLHEFDGSWYLGFLALRDGERVHRFRFLVRQSERARFSLDFGRTAFSFRKLPAKEAASLAPSRIKLHRVTEGETIARLAEKQPGLPAPAAAWLRLLNGLGAGEEPAVGDWLKLLEQEQRR